jgi:ABC-type glycerol-3-phosphate transport system permease component
MDAKIKKPNPVFTILSTIRRAFGSVTGAVVRFFRKLLGVRMTRSLAGDLLNILFLSILAVFMAIPLIYVVNNAFKPIDELFLSPPRFFVQNPTTDNLKDLMAIMSNSWVPITRYFFNTLLITVAGTTGHVIFASMAAYVLEKHNFYGQKAFFNLVVMTLMFSPTVTAIPNFVIMSNLKLVDTYWALIIPAIGSSLGLFLMKQFMVTVHDAILEAAKIDGAGEIHIFFRIVMPTVKPAWLTLIIFSSQHLWNSTGGVLIRSEQLKPLPYALNQIMAGGFARAGAASAVGLILMSVPILIFVFSQSQILDTMSTSGIKE